MYLALVSFTPFLVAVSLNMQQRWQFSLLIFALVTVAIHFFSAGWRWQLTPVYVLLGCAAVAYLLPDTLLSQVWLKATGIGVAAVLLALSGVLSWAFPVFQLPLPTGRFTVGTRLEVAGNVPVRLFYPAAPDPKATPYLYLTGLNRPVFGLPAFLYSHLKGKATAAYTGLALAPDKQRYPVIVYTHGGDSFAQENTFRLIELASHGFVIATTEHPKLFSAYGISPQLARQPNYFTEQLVTRILPNRVRDVHVAVAKLEALNEADDMFQGRLELKTLGMLGFSFGGSVASDYCLTSKYCKAVVSLDGSALGNARQGVGAAFLQLSQSVALPVAFITNPQTVSERAAAYYQTEVSDLLRNTKTLGFPAYWQRVIGTGHAAFTDLIYWTPARFGPFSKLMGQANRDDVYHTINALSLAFFNEHLVAEGSFTAALQQYEKQLTSIKFELAKKRQR